MCLPIISLPSLIDGISYVKVMFCLFLSVPAFLVILIDVFKTRQTSVEYCLGVLLAITILGIYYFSSTDYRSIFGAPGRNNGLISMLLGVLFVFLGIFIRKHLNAPILIKAIIISSSLTATLSMMASSQIGNSIVPSLDFSSSNFRDNTNLLAPLFAMGIIGGITLAIFQKQNIYALSQLPAVVFIVKWSLLQSYVAIFVGIALIAITRKKKLRRFISLIPLAVISGYALALFIISSELIQYGSSIRERYLTLNYAKENYHLFSFLPINIEALSDFTAKAEVLTPNAFLDDFHNVFLQFGFSYGLLLGIVFFLGLTLVFFIPSSFSRDVEIILPLYAAFYTTLFFGIFSPNYMYFGLTALGFLLGRKTDEIVKVDKNKIVALAFIFLVLFIKPLQISITDLNERIKISNLVTSYPASLEKARIVEEVTSRAMGFEDAEYRNVVARNLLKIGDCVRAQSVTNQMRATNPKETRVRYLEQLRQQTTCSESLR